MIKISDITIDYRSLLERKDTIYYTDQSKPVLGFCMESDEQKIRVEKACISLNGWQEEIDEIAYVIYGGEELLPMQTYTIRVQVKTTDGNHTEAHATFETGRMGYLGRGIGSRIHRSLIRHPYHRDLWNFAKRSFCKSR